MLKIAAALIALVSIVVSVITLISFCTKKINIQKASGFGIISTILLCIAFALS